MLMGPLLSVGLRLLVKIFSLPVSVRSFSL